jgi:hypothetical protein
MMRGRDSIAPSVLDHLFQLADSTGFFTLPESTRRDPDLCPRTATDHPSVIVTLYSPSATKRVEHYLGCHFFSAAGKRVPPVPRVAAFLSLADSIDAAAGTDRWRRDRSP